MTHRILVRAVNWLGDSIMAMPALQSLRQAHPDAGIAVLCPEALSEVWRHCPAVDELIGFPRGARPRDVAYLAHGARADTALVLPYSFRSALEMWLARIPTRVGYGGRGRGILLTQRVQERAGRTPMRLRSSREVRRLAGGKAAAPRRPPPTAHHMYQYLHLAEALGAKPVATAPRLEVAADDVEEARSRYCVPWRNLPLIAVAPGGQYGPAKRWPADRFARVAELIQREADCIWMLLGGPADADACRAISLDIQERIGSTRCEGGPAAVLNLAGRTELRDLFALLAASDLLLCNDSGPMHVAAALRTPVVALFGSTSPELTSPGNVGDPLHNVLSAGAACSPCFLRECPIDFRCMLDISPERAAAAILSRLGSGVQAR